MTVFHMTLLRLLGVSFFLLVVGCSQTPRQEEVFIPGEMHVPHAMTGQLAKQLNSLQGLPEPTQFSSNASISDLYRFIEMMQVEHYFSVFVTLSATDASSKSIDKILGSWRADVIRPDSYHVSQALWDTESDMYLLNEWVSLGDQSYLNTGMWVEVPPEQEYHLRNTMFLPETFFNTSSSAEVETDGIVQIQNERYHFFRVKQTDPDGRKILVKSWFGQDTGRLHKYKIVYLDGSAMTYSLIYHDGGKQLTITPPPCVNWVPETGKLDLSVYCKSMHWSFPATTQ